MQPVILWFARILGFLTLANGLFDLLFPRQNVRLTREFEEMPASARRLHAAWAFLAGVLLVWLATQPAAEEAGFGQFTARERRAA